MADEQREAIYSPSRSRHTDKQEGGSSQRRERRRSRSPRRERHDEKSRKKDSGFKWKEKRRDEGNAQLDRENESYKSQRDHYRPRSRSPRLRSPRHNDTVEKRDSEVAEKKERKEKKKEKKTAPVMPAQEMIIVYVNDRLGTKKAVPCFATDPIKDFKVIVASMIGRQPHEILLKRQGERPFKDQLTLQDYGVSNNVQLDLEVDTGD